MFKKILVALDLSGAGKKVFEQGIALAKLDPTFFPLTVTHQQKADKDSW